MGSRTTRTVQFAWLTISGSAPVASASPVRAARAKLERLAGGFFNISGGAVDSAGDLYFVDARRQMIYRWSTATREVQVVRDNPLDPVQLAFDKSDNLMVISYLGNGTVYTFRPGSNFDQITLLKPEPSVARPGMTPVVPLDYWRNENDFQKVVTAPRPYQFISLDRSTFIPAGEDFVSGKLYYGSKMHDVIRAFGLAPAMIGATIYVCDEEEQKTYQATISEDGTLTNLKLFVNVGGESVAQDTQGNVYIAAGQVYVFSPEGKLIDTIEMPERPTQLLFGGADRKTLFIAGRSSLYAVQVR